MYRQAGFGLAVMLLGLWPLPAFAWFGWSSCYKELRWSPDSRRLCFAEYRAFSGGDVDDQTPTGDEQIVIATLDNPPVVNRLTPAGGLTPSPTGSKVVVGGGYVLDMAGGRVQQLPVTGKLVSWSPDEKYLAVVTLRPSDPDPELCPRELYIVDPSSGRATQILPAKPNEELLIRDCRWADNRTVSCSLGQEGDGVRFLEVDVVTGAVKAIGYADFRPEAVARPIVVDTVLESAVMLRMPDGQCKAIALPLAPGPVRVRSGSVSPDGSAVAFEWIWDNNPDAGWRWSCIRVDGTGWSYIGPQPLWLAGSRLAYVEQEHPACGVGILEPDGRVTIQAVCRSGGTITALKTAPGGGRLMFEARDGNEVWLGVVDIGGHSIWRVRGTHSGQWLEGGDRLFCRDGDDYVLFRADGAEQTRVPFVHNGYAPQWIADTVMLFRAGYSVCEYLRGEGEQGPPTLHYSATDPVWQVNPLTGQMKPASQTIVQRYASRVGTSEGSPIRSPDGTRIAWIETRGQGGDLMYVKSRIWVADADGGNKRLLMESTANFAWRGSSEGD